jgi:hypothetical protein
LSDGFLDSGVALGTNPYKQTSKPSDPCKWDQIF